MRFEELAASLEERLSFYKTVLDMMEKAVVSGDTEALAAYTKLEERTAREIAVRGECFAARAAESPSSEFTRRINASHEAAREASLRVRRLLAKEKEAVAAQLKEVRRQNNDSGTPPGSPLPLVIDIEA